MGLQGNVHRLMESGDEKFLKMQEIVEDAKKRAEGGWIRARGVYQYFLAGSEGNDVVIFAPADNGSSPRGAELARFTFPRQAEGERLCLADFVAPIASDDTDSVAMFVTSCGAGVRKLSEELKGKGDYLLSQTVQALAIESAEAFAEKLHHDLRLQWGIEDPSDFTMADIHKARYQGIRVSFGYPACPDLSDQATLWRLLRPETVGVELTEGFMMDPEASVSALVFHHPQAKYFGVGVAEEELAPV
jgi:5-methyltetrahydrofolate--homocysteine methyltransferase